MDSSDAPIKTKRVGSRKVPWITSDLRKGMHALDKRLRNRINGEFIQSNSDSRKTWQMIKGLTSRQKSNVSVKETRRELSNQFSRPINAFNDHFSTTGTKLANEVPLDGLCRLHC